MKCRYVCVCRVFLPLAVKRCGNYKVYYVADRYVAKQLFEILACVFPYTCYELYDFFVHYALEQVFTENFFRRFYETQIVAELVIRKYEVCNVCYRVVFLAYRK